MNRWHVFRHPTPLGVFAELPWIAIRTYADGSSVEQYFESQPAAIAYAHARAQEEAS